jgi:hypothetical protein
MTMKIIIHISEKLVQIIFPHLLKKYKVIRNKKKRIITYIYPIDSNTIQKITNDMDIIKFWKPYHFEKIKECNVEITFGSNKKDGEKILFEILDINQFNKIGLIFHRRVSRTINFSHVQKIDKIRAVHLRGKFYPLDNANFNNIENLHLGKHHQFVKTLPNTTNLFLTIQQVNLGESRIENIYCLKPFNKSLDGLNNYVKKISIDSPDFSYPLLNLPNGLRSLTIVSSVYNEELDMLPDSIEYLALYTPLYDKNLSNLPNGIKTLVIKYIKSSNNTNIILPTGLKSLIIKKEYLSMIGYIPENVQVEKITDKNTYYFYNKL